MTNLYISLATVAAPTPAQELIYTIGTYIIIGILALGAFTAFVAFPIAVLCYLIKWGTYIFSEEVDVRKIKRAVGSTRL